MVAPAESNDEVNHAVPAGFGFRLWITLRHPIRRHRQMAGRQGQMKQRSYRWNQLPSRLRRRCLRHLVTQ